MASSYFVVTMTANTTLALSGWSTAVQECIVQVVQNATGGWTLTLPSGVTWPYGTPTINAAPNTTTYLKFNSLDSGTTVVGQQLMGLPARVMCPNPRTDGGDDAVILNALFASTATNSTIEAPPGVTYNCATTVVLQPGRRYDFGQFYPNTQNDPPAAGFAGAVIRMAPGANLNALISSPAVQGTGTATDNAITIDGLCVDGNKANQTGGAGIGVDVAFTGSTFANVGVFDCLGHGWVHDNANSAGSVFSVGGTHENRYIGAFKVAGCGGYGFWSKSIWTDGYIGPGFVVSSCGLGGIRVDGSGGWDIDGPHVWSVGGDGIFGNGVPCRIHDAYVEGFGSSTLTGGGGINTYYAYSSASTYAMYTPVTSASVMYWSLINSNTGHTPASSPSQWAPMNPITGSGVTGIGISSISGARPADMHDNTCSIGHVSIPGMVGIQYRPYLLQFSASGAAAFHHNSAQNEYLGASVQAEPWLFSVSTGTATISGANLNGGGIETNLTSGTFTSAAAVNALCVPPAPAIGNGSGAPTCAGTVGQYYFRTDTPGTTNQRVYVCASAGAAGAATWVGIV